MAKRKCMADGGIIGNDGLTDAQRAKLNGARASLGISNAPPPQAQPAPQVQPLPQPTPQAQPSGGGIVNILKNRGQQIDKAAGYAKGGIINDAAEYWANDNAEFEKTNPGFVDRVIRGVNPMTGFGSAMGAMHTAAGNGDIPGMVMAGIQSIPAVGVLRAIPAAGAMKASVAPSLAKTAGAVAGGAVANAAADEFQKRDNNYQAGGIVRGIGTPTSDDVPMTVNGKGVNLSNTEAVLPHATVMALGGPKAVEALIEATNGKPPVKGGLKEGGEYAGGLVSNNNVPDEYTNELERRLFDRASQIGPSSKPVGIDAGVSAVGNLFADSAKAAREGRSYTDVRAERVAATGQPATPQQAKPAAQNPLASITAPVGIRSGADTAAANYGQGSVRNPSGTGQFAENGKTYDVAATSQPGISRVTSAGMSPLYTNIDPSQAMKGLSDQRIGGDPNEGIARMQRANDIRQSMIDSQPQGGIAVLPEGTLPGGMSISDWNKNVGSGDAMRGMGSRTRATLMANAENNETQRRGQDMAQQTANSRDQLTARGQDLQAQSDANRLAGNPSENALKQAQTQGIMAGINRDKAYNELRDKAYAGDKEAIARLQAVTGHDRQQFQSHVVGGGKDEFGNPLPSYLATTDAQGNVRFHSPNGQQVQQKVITADQRKAVEAALPNGMTFDQYAKQHNIIVK